MASSSGNSTLDLAIRLATQAVHQDTRKNYAEAARCYRDAVVAFRTLAAPNAAGNNGRGSKSAVSPRVRAAIEDKCVLYERRLRKLDRHLLSKADLSRLFRQCVDSELRTVQSRPESRRRHRSCSSQGSSSQGSDELEVTSVDSEDLYENPGLRRGLDLIEKAKREDARTHFPEALHFYEQGAGALLDCVRRGRVATPRHAEYVRIKCLLIHDRCEQIRNHLDFGSPLKVRKETLDHFETALECSPESDAPSSPLFEEEQALLMEECRSNAGASVAGSTHSLYPTCVEVRRSPSAMSGHSDFNSSMLAPVGTVVTAQVIVEERREKELLLKSSTPDSIPLADIDAEMQLSALSLSSRASTPASSSSSQDDSYDTVRRKKVSNVSSCSSNASHEHLLHQLRRAASSNSVQQRRSSSREEGVLFYDRHTGKLSVSCASLGDQRDRNVSEVTFANDELDVDRYNAGSKANDSGSDSGFSDPSTEREPPVTVVASVPEVLLSESPVHHHRNDEDEDDDGAATDDRKSPLSDIASLDIVPSTPQPSPDGFQKAEPPSPSSATPSSTPSPTPSPSRNATMPRRTRSNRSGGSSVKDDEGVTVLSEETVVDGVPTTAATKPKKKVKVSAAPPDAYALASPAVSVRARPAVAGSRPEEAVPPRARAYEEDFEEDDEGLNKGCYYFMACLDSFWIL